MKVQKQLSRKVKGKKYPKYVVTIPPNDINQLGWKEGTELDREIKGQQIILRPRKNPEQ